MVKPYYKRVNISFNDISDVSTKFTILTACQVRCTTKMYSYDKEHCILTEYGS